MYLWLGPVQEFMVPPGEEVPASLLASQMHLKPPNISDCVLFPLAQHFVLLGETVVCDSLHQPGRPPLRHLPSVCAVVIPEK